MCRRRAPRESHTVNSFLQPTSLAVYKRGYKVPAKAMMINLPGIGDTVIKQAVPPSGDLCIALGQVETCDLPKRGRLGCAIFDSGGLRSRVPRYMIKRESALNLVHTCT